MDGMLSQEEINALLNETGGSGDAEQPLTDSEKDAIGEVANISMGTAATTLFSLVNRKVDISTPVVTTATWDDLVAAYERPCVFIRIGYTVGLDGSNVLVLKEHDVKVITDLMMGGDGTNTQEELGEMHLSAICEAMNQMMGSSATSLSTMLDKMIDISPPEADVVDVTETMDGGEIDTFLAGEFVMISFRMEIGDLVNSQIMQLYPFSFAREMCSSITKNMEMDTESTASQQNSPVTAEPPQPVNTAAVITPASTRLNILFFIIFSSCFFLLIFRPASFTLRLYPRPVFQPTDTTAQPANLLPDSFQRLSHGRSSRRHPVKKGTSI